VHNRNNLLNLTPRDKAFTTFIYQQQTIRKYLPCQKELLKDDTPHIQQQGPSFQSKKLPRHVQTTNVNNH
jgi:hypothetical protein